MIDLNLVELKPPLDKNAKFYSHLVNFSSNLKNRGDALLSNDLFPIWYYLKNDENWENLKFEYTETLPENTALNDNITVIDSTLTSSSIDISSEVADSELLEAANELDNNINPDLETNSINSNENSSKLDSSTEITISEVPTKNQEVDENVKANGSEDIELNNGISDSETFSRIVQLSEITDIQLVEVRDEDIDLINDDIILDSQDFQPIELISNSSVDIDVEVASIELVEARNDEDIISGTTIDLVSEIADVDLVEARDEERIDFGRLEFDVDDTAKEPSDLERIDIKLNQEINEFIDIHESELLTFENESTKEEGKIFVHFSEGSSSFDLMNLSIEEIKIKLLDTKALQGDINTELNSEIFEIGKVNKQKKKYIDQETNGALYEEMEGLNEFNKWLIKLDPIAESNIDKIRKSKKKYKKKKKKYILEEGIASSIRSNNALVSESLAQILAHQGHKVKAIEMYNQLILNYPEKSVYFAAQIEKLKTD